MLFEKSCSTESYLSQCFKTCLVYGQMSLLTCLLLNPVNSQYAQNTELLMIGEVIWGMGPCMLVHVSHWKTKFSHFYFSNGKYLFSFIVSAVKNHHCSSKYQTEPNLNDCSSQTTKKRKEGKRSFRSDNSICSLNKCCNIYDFPILLQW